MRTDQGTGRHVSTGKLLPRGEMHAPQWSIPRREDGMWFRQCRHPDCDIDDYTTDYPRPLTNP